ncbi:unnamed protein product [Acanthoscelides obtectus]|uniref:Uncharacterized protein n=1 Tax=Acanthoscelides obtectus TaxID=200917 RepID=A0A9P0M0B5_ACAOB|nr:unnamed protein product [Acanthoscelides obtectus]CAK1643629.1 hypothetical protein AOBTE_LOCUS13611 [Acanthoscelides obtectus]
MSVLTFSFTSFLFGRLITTREISYETLPVQCYIPDAVPIWVMFLWQTIHLYFLFFSSGTPLFTMCAMTYTSLQLKILDYELRGIFEHVDVDNDDVFRNVQSRIAKCSKHHSFLLSFRSTLNEAFSTVMILYLGLMILVLCIGLYASFALKSREDILRTLAYVAIYNVEFFVCYCFPSQILMDYSEGLSDTLYFTKWYQYPKFNKMVLLLLCQLQVTVAFNVRGIASFGYDIGLRAIKTVVSYCMFLRAIIL